MTPKAQRIAIAGALGWRNLHFSGEHGWDLDRGTGYLVGTTPMGSVFSEFVPNYLGSLDAMAQAEALLETLGQKLSYRFHLDRIVRGLEASPSGYVPNYTRDDSTTAWHLCVTATAPQRAEAFLRTCELWR